MKFDVNLAKKTSSNNLPNQSKYKVLSSFNEIRRTNIDDRSKSLCRIDDEVVIFDHLKLAEFLAFIGFVQNTFIDGLKISNSLIPDFTSGTESLMSLERTNPSLHSSNICIVSSGKGRRLPISGSPAKTAFICLVNSVRSSSFMV